MTFRVYIFILFLDSSLWILFPKQKKGGKEIEDADEHMKHGNYIMALPILKDLLKRDKDNKKLEYKIAICYLNTNYTEPKL